MMTLTSAMSVKSIQLILRPFLDLHNFQALIIYTTMKAIKRRKSFIKKKKKRLNNNDDNNKRYCRVGLVVET